MPYKNKKRATEAHRKWRLLNPGKVRLNQRKAQQKYRAKNIERLRARDREIMANRDKEKERKRQKKWVSENRPRVRELVRNFKRKKAGFTPELFSETLKLQKGQCAICSEILLNPCADHNHLKGTARGILCIRCNSGLGMFRDNPEFIESALGYILKWSAKR